GEIQFTFPRCLSWWRCWATYSSLDELLFPRDIRQTIRVLEPNRILANLTTEDSPYYSILGNQSEMSLERVLLHSQCQKTIPFQFTVSWTSSQLAFEICILERLESDDYQYWIELRGCRYGDASLDCINHGFIIRYAGFEYWEEEAITISLCERENG